jgi:hypothetical protein
LVRKSSSTAAALPDKFVYPRAYVLGALSEVLAYRAYLTLNASAVLLDRALDACAPLAKLAPKPPLCPPHTALEPIPGCNPASLAATELTFEAGAGAVLSRQALDRGDHVVAHEQASADLNENDPLGELLHLLDRTLRVRGVARRLRSRFAPGGGLRGSRLV